MTIDLIIYLIGLIICWAVIGMICGSSRLYTTEDCFWFCAMALLWPALLVFLVPVGFIWFFWSLGSWLR